MDSEWTATLSQAGVDVKQALARFANNEVLYLHFLGKFLQDPNFEGIIACASNQDNDEMLTYAHTLKGVTGNLGLTPLYQTLDAMVLRLRSRQTGGMDVLVPQLEQEYRRMCKTIEKVAGER